MAVPRCWDSLVLLPLDPAVASESHPTSRDGSTCLTELGWVPYGPPLSADPRSGQTGEHSEETHRSKSPGTLKQFHVVSWEAANA